MSEKAMWVQLSKLCKGFWDATRHEDMAIKGLPDVSFGYDGKQGWIELKFLKQFPVTEERPVKLTKFTPQQRLFLYNRGRHGGNCWLLLKVENYQVISGRHAGRNLGNVWLLFDWQTVRRMDGSQNTGQLVRMARKVWGPTLPKEAFLTAIVDDCEAHVQSMRPS